MTLARYLFPIVPVTGISNAAATTTVIDDGLAC
jgi:hypothetical protein